MFPCQGQTSLDGEVLFCSGRSVTGITVTLYAMRDQLLAVPGDFRRLKGGTPIGKIDLVSFDPRKL